MKNYVILGEFLEMPIIVFESKSRTSESKLLTNEDVTLPFSIAFNKWLLPEPFNPVNTTKFGKLVSSKRFIERKTDEKLRIFDMI